MEDGERLGFGDLLGVVGHSYSRAEILEHNGISVIEGFSLHEKFSH
jgi:hypothetical protein